MQVVYVALSLSFFLYVNGTWTDDVFTLRSIKQCQGAINLTVYTQRYQTTTAKDNNINNNNNDNNTLSLMKIPSTPVFSFLSIRKTHTRESGCDRAACSGQSPSSSSCLVARQRWQAPRESLPAVLVLRRQSSRSVRTDDEFIRATLPTERGDCVSGVGRWTVPVEHCHVQSRRLRLATRPALEWVRARRSRFRAQQVGLGQVATITYFRRQSVFIALTNEYEYRYMVSNPVFYTGVPILCSDEPVILFQWTWF